jgi:hypothetical protein
MVAIARWLATEVFPEDFYKLIPSQTIVSTMTGPLNPPILGDFETGLARKSPRIGGLGGSSPGFVT